MNSPQKSSKRVDLIRWALGIIGFACCGIWLFCYFAWGWDEVVNAVGVAIIGRVGLILVVVWGALPALQPLFKYASVFLLGSILVTLIVLAARPRIVPIVVGVLAVASFMNWLMRFLAKYSSNRRNQSD